MHPSLKQTKVEAMNDEQEDSRQESDAAATNDSNSTRTNSPTQDIVPFGNQDDDLRQSMPSLAISGKTTLERLFPAQSPSPQASESMSDTLSEIQRFVNTSQTQRTNGASYTQGEGQSNASSSSGSNETPYLALFQQVLQQQNAQNSTSSAEAPCVATGHASFHGAPGMEAQSTLGLANQSGDRIHGVGVQNQGTNLQQGTQPLNLQPVWNMMENSLAHAVTPASWYTNLLWAHVLQPQATQQQQATQQMHQPHGTQQQDNGALSLSSGPVIQGMMSQIVQGAQWQNDQRALLTNFIAAVQLQQPVQQQQQQQPVALQALIDAMTQNTSMAVAQSSDLSTVHPLLGGGAQPFQPAGVNPLNFLTRAQNSTGLVPSVPPFVQSEYNVATSASPSQVVNVNAVSTSTSSADESGDPPKKRYKRPYNHESFPAKLHRLLAESESENRDDVISFNAEGTVILIHQPEVFEDEILGHYFRHNKLSSFKRQLSMYGFVRILGGPDEGGFAHPLFLKHDPNLSTKMDRVN